MLESITRHLLYAGLTKKEYEAIGEDIDRQNWSQLTIYSSVVMLILSVLSVSAWHGSGYGGINRRIYIAALGLCLIIAILGRLLREKFPRSIQALSFCFEALLYGFAFALSLIHRDVPSVTVVAFLLLVPQMFFDCPLFSGVKTLFVALAFCALSRRIKAPEVASADLYNTMVFAVAAFVVDLLVTELKMRCLSQERQILYLSETDVMTGLKNRNCYERTLAQLPELCKSHVTSIYGDVNGLHEINNTQGHDAGDRMLIKTANAMKKHFGEAHLYRIGGDEFVSIQLDNEPDVAGAIEKIGREIAEDNYHMSFGVCRQDKAALDTPSLIRQAEEAMYREKTAYYEKMGIPIRNE